MAATEALAWLRSELPSETADLRFADDDHVLDELLAWAPAGQTITAFDEDCHAIQLTRNERTLDGPFHVRTTTTPTAKTISTDSISFGRGVTLTCGSDKRYERTNGGWTLASESATGCDQTVGHRLSEVTADTASYDGVDAEITIHCGVRHDRARRCSDGVTRTCSTCDGVALDIASREGGFKKSAPSAITAAPAGADVVDCSMPCPIDVRSAKIARANVALAHAHLATTRPTHPLLYRTLAACRARPRAHDGP